MLDSFLKNDYIPGMKNLIKPKIFILFARSPFILDLSLI